MGFFSKAWKAVEKVFKKVVSVVKKVAPYAIAAATVFFAASSALGGTSFNTFSRDALASIGIKDGLLADTLVSAAKQAGIGSLIGGGVSLATGGDFADGAGTGALVGAATGAATGFLNSDYTLGSPNTLPTGNPAQTAVGKSLIGGTGNDTLPVDDAAQGYGTLGETGNGGTVTRASTAAPAAPAVGAPRTGVLGFWDEIKGEGIIGPVIAGVGKAIVGGEDVGDRTEAARVNRETADANAVAEAQRRRDAYILPSGQAASSVAGLTPTPQVGGLLTARNRFGPGTLNTGAA
jgi:hypothetical protein